MPLSITVDQYFSNRTSDSLKQTFAGNGKVSKDGNPIVRASMRDTIIAGTLAAGVAVVGVVGVLIMAAGGAFGSLLAGIAMIAILVALPVLWSLGLKAIQYVYTFNWNVTDAELDKQLETKLEALYGMTGALVGQLMGYFICGALPGTVAFAFNPAVAKVVLSNVAEEAKEEIYEQLAIIAQGALSTLTNALAIKAFQGTRKWAKRPGSPVYNILKEALGENFTKWGDEGRPSFSFSGQVEERVEKIKDPKLKNFSEEFLENFGEACIHAGTITVTSIHSQMAAQKLMQEQLIGKQQTIAIDLNP
ncbi:hypothetical protein [Coleofasciculus sp. FACHB-1120]|uniref:hypothetical protein n=1 Tax=Coleofasciculus sp. FACHB-1120 TaxID=2692783 RepID=UPI001685B65C|nr:hypothetical protein [Coleofasciculus sp. FACHB-1120]MBD2743655.1 hypothetical protein [Coleofasciculus sp. FACHB-1120]